MKGKAPCENCKRPFTEHEIVNTGGRLIWVCPSLERKTE